MCSRIRSVKRAAQTGFTLLETLLALGIATILVVISVNSYEHYAAKSASLEVNNDVSSILQALNNYFHVQGCDTDGTFAGDQAPSLTDDLKLSRLENGRPPLVSGYSVAITDSGIVTQDEKPIYELEISATLSTDLSPEELAWYQARLNATSFDDETHALIWQHLPAYNVHTASAQFWILNGSLSRFRQWENSLSSSAGSYCAQ